MWVDSDVLVTGPLGRRLDAAGERLVATEDVWYGSGQRSGDRTRAWNLEIGRILPATLNTAILQVGHGHLALLATWRELLQSPPYQRAQAMPYEDRPQHMVGDQDVITALIESSAWRHVDVDLLSRGLEIAQCYGSAGFSPQERLHLGRRRLPLAVHAMGPKPWRVLSTVSQPGSYWLRTHSQLTPYTALALQYASHLPAELDWAQQRTLVGRVLRRAAGENPVLQELPLAVAQWTHWRLRQDAGRIRRRLSRVATRE